MQRVKTMLIDAVKYPGTDWMKVILLGFLSLISVIGVITQLNLFTLLFLIMLPLPIGYLFKIIKTSFRGFDELPNFNSWKEMYADGLKVLLTIFIYALPILLIFILLNQGQLITSVINNYSLIALQPFILGSSIQIIVFIIIGLVEFMGIANMALYDGEFMAAFSFREIVKRISMIGLAKYLACYLIIWLIIALAVLISILTMIALIGIILVPLLIVPYFLVLNTRFLALVFASSEG
jgi:hypothetical protein